MRLPSTEQLSRRLEEESILHRYFRVESVFRNELVDTNSSDCLARPTTFFPTQPDIAATIARIAVGLLFLVHGVPKVRNLKGTMAWVKGTGFPGGAAFAALFAVLEFLGGIALVLGFLTQVAAVLFVLEMIATSIFSKTKLGKKFVLGYELDAVYLLLALTVALLGPGPWSLDRIIGLA